MMEKAKLTLGISIMLVGMFMISIVVIPIIAIIINNRTDLQSIIINLLFTEINNVILVGIFCMGIIILGIGSIIELSRKI